MKLLELKNKVLRYRNPEKKLFVRKRALVPSLILLLVFMSQVESINIEDGRISKKQITSYIAGFNPNVSWMERDALVESILVESRRLQIPQTARIDGRPINRAHFLTALIQVESSFYRHAVSSADARGYMQLMPATVAWMDNLYGTYTPNIMLFHGKTNISRGVTYLNMLFAELGDARLVSLAYNAGPGAVRRGYYIENYWTKIHVAYRKLQKKEYPMKATGHTVL